MTACFKSQRNESQTKFPGLHIFLVSLSSSLVHRSHMQMQMAPQSSNRRQFWSGNDADLECRRYLCTSARKHTLRITGRCRSSDTQDDLEPNKCPRSEVNLEKSCCFQPLNWIHPSCSLGSLLLSTTGCHNLISLAMYTKLICWFTESAQLHLALILTYVYIKVPARFVLLALQL